MSWEKPTFEDISLSMEATSYANSSDDLGGMPSDPSFDF